MKVLKAADKAFEKAFPVFASINMYLDSDLYGKLIASENATVLANLAALYDMY